MHHASAILLTIFIIFVAAEVGAELAQRLKLPAVVGEIAAGCMVGPSMLDWLPTEQLLPGTFLEVLAELGVVMLLFSVGLETRLEDLKKVGKSAVLVGSLGVLLPLLAGALWAHGEGFTWVKSLFVAAAFVATSAGITARVLQELGVLKRIESHVILGAAVIDDILAMLLLGVVSTLQNGGELELSSLLITLSSALGFVIITAWGGTRIMQTRSAWLEKPLRKDSSLTLVLALCLGLAWLSTRFGLAAIIGAFLAGMMASETTQREELEHKIQPLLAFLTPFFFVVTGAKVKLNVLGSSEALYMLGVVTLIAILSKLLGGFLGALSLGRQRAVMIGFGMVPRGEVGVVIASLGLSIGVFNDRIYAIIVAMSLLTAMLTPPILKMLLRRAESMETQIH